MRARRFEPVLRSAGVWVVVLMLLALVETSTAQAQTPITAAATVQFSGEIDTSPSCTSATTITINWGDGTASSSGSYDANGNVAGTHTYAASGTYNGTVTFSPSCGFSPDMFIATVAPAPEFTQCPPVYDDFGCQFLMVVSNSGTTIGQDTNQGPYEGAEDALIGIVNNSSDPITSIPLSSAGSSLFSFDEDGICDPGGTPVPSGCVPQAGAPAGTTCLTQDGACAFPPPSGEPAGYVEPGAVPGYRQNGYEGPTTWFSNVSADTSSGQVNFSPALQPGQSTYFGLEEPPSASGLAAHSPPSGVSSSPPTVTSSGARFSGLVNPNGSSTTAHFQYGLDPKYSGGGPLVYDQSTPTQLVGGDFADHVVSASVSGLVPNALYHARIVASNANGTTYGPDQTFTTRKDPVPGAPTLGRTANVIPVSGLVFIKVPRGKTFYAVRALAAGSVVKGQGFIPLTQARQVPTGSEIDARRGTLKLVVASTKKHHTVQARLAGSVFSLSQARSGLHKGLTTFALKERAFTGAPSYASCSARKASIARAGPDAQLAKLSPKVLQTLKASEHGGKFRTKGRYSAATVRGTEWWTEDRCDGTLTIVKRGSVSVFDDHTRKTIIVKAGHSYLAKA